MGAWGHNYFENDAALDFVGDIEESDNPKEVIRNVFEEAVDSDYLESDEGSAVIAAAAYVDRQTNGTKFSPADGEESYLVDTFPDRHPNVDLSDLRHMAVEALRQVLNDESELRELWEETGEFGQWRFGVEQLIVRLTA